MQRKHLILTSLFLLVSGLRADAAATNTFTVKAGGGGNFATIAACSALAIAGDTCIVFAGTYSGWTPLVSGIAGLPITFTVNPGDTVTVTGGINANNLSYITIHGFTFSSGATIQGNASTQHWIIDGNNFTGNTVWRILDGIGSTGSDNVFSNNKVNVGVTSSRQPAVYVYGDRNRFENNEFFNGSGDCFDVGGANLVIRNNYCHDMDASLSGEHLDFVQIIGGGTSPTLSFSLIENNINRNCINDGGNCHGFIILRTGSGPVADTNIIRFNYAQNIDGDCINFGGAGDNVPNNSAYNNTCASGHLASYNESFDSVQGATPNTTVLNNIAYNVQAGGQYPFGANFENGNLAFTTGFSGSWGSPYSGEATYAALHNKNPLFANYPTDSTLQAGSPAIGAGVALTTVAAGDSGSGTILIVNNAHVFQPGWTGVQADWIRVGPTTASPTVQIASINYNTNTITLVSSISRSGGNPVYLYKNSKGTIVLNNNNPDVGASQSGTQAQGPPPNPPGNLQAIVN
jgi:hypothetical protein